MENERKKTAPTQEPGFHYKPNYIVSMNKLCPITMVSVYPVGSELILSRCSREPDPFPGQADPQTGQTWDVDSDSALVLPISVLHSIQVILTQQWDILTHNGSCLT